MRDMIWPSSVSSSDSLPSSALHHMGILCLIFLRGFSTSYICRNPVYWRLRDKWRVAHFLCGPLANKIKPWIKGLVCILWKSWLQREYGSSATAVSACNLRGTQHAGTPPQLTYPLSSSIMFCHLHFFACIVCFVKIVCTWVRENSTSE